jgi:hypothetical protein
MPDPRVRFTCPECKGPLAVPADRAGQAGKCPKCGAKITVPDAPSFGGDDLVDALSRDFARVRDMLAVRLQPKMEALRQPPGTLVTQDFGTDLVQLLVYNLPNMVVPVPRKHFEAWNRPIGDLFRMGVENIRKDGRLESRIQDVPGAVRIGILADPRGRNPFTTSHIFFFEDYFGTDHPHGVLFGIPQRRCILFHPIVDQGVVASVDALLGSLLRAFREGPESLSPNLYWWNDGKITLLPSSLEGKELRFNPPESFIRLVESLPPASEHRPKPPGRRPGRA